MVLCSVLASDLNGVVGKTEGEMKESACHFLQLEGWMQGKENKN